MSDKAPPATPGQIFMKMLAIAVGVFILFTLISQGFRDGMINITQGLMNYRVTKQDFMQIVLFLILAGAIGKLVFAAKKKDD